MKGFNTAQTDDWVHPVSASRTRAELRLVNGGSRGSSRNDRGDLSPTLMILFYAIGAFSLGALFWYLNRDNIVGLVKPQAPAAVEQRLTY